MFDTAPEATHQHLSHDMPCPHCGHARHTFLACSDSCACRPAYLTAGGSVDHGADLLSA